MKTKQLFVSTRLDGYEAANFSTSWYESGNIKQSINGWWEEKNTGAWLTGLDDNRLYTTYWLKPDFLSFFYKNYISTSIQTQNVHQRVDYRKQVSAPWTAPGSWNLIAYNALTVIHANVVLKAFDLYCVNAFPLFYAWIKQTNKKKQDK